MAKGMLLFKRTRSTIRKWGDIFVSKLKQTLKADRTYASGRTHDSIKGRSVISGNSIGYQIESKSAGNSQYSMLEIIDKGRRPGKQPPVQAIMYWMEQKGVQPRTSSGKYAKSSESNLKWAAFNIARAIGKKGTIRRYGYGGSDIMGFVFKTQEQQMELEIVDSFARDVEDYIDNGIPTPVTGKR